jgi:serine protease Do
VRTLGELRGIETRVKAVYGKTLPATVALLSDAAGSSGSGTVIRPDGLIATAAHVVMGSEVLRVLFPDGREYAGRVLGADFTRDVALVKIQSDGRTKFPAVELGESAPLAVGDWVVALGHSAGFDPARKPPLRFGRVVSMGPGEMVTTDCSLIGGDSGGPLFDLDGRLIGIHSSIGGAVNNNNHAGIDALRKDWKRLMAGETWGKLSLNPLANPDTPVLGFVMGVGRGGVPVDGVVAGSPAARAGLRPGDVLIHLDGKRITDGKTLLVELAHMKPGRRVKLGILRGRRQMELGAVLARRGDFYQEDR